MDEVKSDNVSFYVGDKLHDAKLISEKIISINMGNVTYDLSKIPVSNGVNKKSYKNKSRRI